MQIQQFSNILPHLDTLTRAQAQQLLPKLRQFYWTIDDQKLSVCLFNLTDFIMRLKSINPQLQDFMEQCIKDAIRVTIKKKFVAGTEALRNIFSTQAEYYKHSKLDIESRCPLGLRHPLQNYEPEVGEQCDIVKPYISSITYCGWTRGTIIAKDGKKYVVKYANTQVLSDTKQQPFCAPLGTRTLDFDWRMNLNIGDRVDAYHKIWWNGTVKSVQSENGVKRVRITFKTYSQNGSQVDKFGQRYDGLDDQEDQLYEITSYRIQKPDKMAKNFCLYSLNAEEFLTDDTYDIIFENEYAQQHFRAIMRLNFMRSLSYLQFYETFCDQGGNEEFISLLQNYNKDALDSVFNTMIVIANSSFLIPRMRVHLFLPQMLDKVISCMYDNSKSLSPQRNEMVSFFIDVVGKRFMSLSEKHLLVNGIRKRLILDFLKLNMEKQMIALRLLYELINPIPRKYSEAERKEVDQFLRKNDIFYQIIQPNTHEQILLRSTEFIRYLLQTSIICFKQIEYLWNIYPPSDLRGKSTVQRMISQLSKNFSIEDTRKVIKKILSYKESELTVDNLTLLRSLKDHKELDDEERLQILKVMWEIITMKAMNVTQLIEQEVEKVFKSIVPSLQSKKTKLQLLRLILARLSQIKTLHNEFDILKEFILTYPKKLSTSNTEILKIEQEPQTIRQISNSLEQQPQQTIPSILSEVIEFLKQQNIYRTIINIFNQLKSESKMKNVLWFTSFLFENDTGNVSQIVKVFYDKMGPADIFFDWAQHITSKAHEFFVQFFNNLEAISKFEQLSINGFDALKVILFDVNIHEGNLKLIKKAKAIGVQSDGTSNSSTAGSTQKGPIYGPTQRPQTLTFLYLLKSPYECKGMQFLQQLLLVVKNNKVYDEIIKLIIQFFVNLDQSIEERTKQFREQFLMDIIVRFRETNERNEYNQKIKLRLQMNVSLLQQLFAETQKQGLFDIRPHFECVQGEMLKFKVENHLTNNKILDPRIEINQNSTLYTLKVKLGEVFRQKPEDLVVLKFNTAIADELNAKSLSDLHFYNEETLRVQRKGAKQIPRKQLLNETGEALTPKFDAIVEKWFQNYKNENGQMGIQELKRLSGELWRGSALKEASKLNEIVQKFDQQSKGYLNLEEFKQFFIYKSAQSQAAIWKILNLSGYKNNLRYKDDPQPQTVSSAQIYPRRILSTEIVYKTIFSILQNKTFEPVHLNFYRLLALLQTDKSLKQQVKQNAKLLIEDEMSVYKLSYILETTLSEILVNDEFYFEFYRNKGCEFIVHKLKSFVNQQSKQGQSVKSIYTMDTLIKTIIMPNMVKILNSYLFCLYSESSINRYLRKAKINHIELDFMVSQLNKIEQVIGSQNQFKQRLQTLQSVEFYFNIEEIHSLSQKIFQNLIQNYNNQLLQKITNEIIRMYGVLTLSSNKINTKLMIKGLMCESLNYRRACQNITYLYLLNNPQQVKPFLELLLQSLPQESKIIYSYFFTLLQKVLEMYLDAKKDEKDDSEFIQLADKLFKKLFDDLPNESRNTVTADKLLLGVLVVIKILLVKRQGVRKHFKYLKKDLLEKCLFFYHPKDRIAQVEITPQMLKTEKQANHFNDYVKCKSQDTRKILMEIIFHLHQVSAQEDPLFIDQYILPIFNDLPKQKKKFDPKSMQVGLANLGSTCYLNSMLQVLNSVGAFRNIIMQTEIDAPLVRELKSMFAYLFFSQRQDYLPESLLQAFVPPIIKGIQQDTTEFLNILLDQLDNYLKGTSVQNLLEEIFQGTQATQMICSACGQKRQRQETFFTYSVDIEGKYDLNTALQGMHTGEVISDCLCEYCGQRADTTKRTIIDTVPNLFFVPLKRIVFNYDMFVNTKIHTRLQFPTELNFEPYTKEGVELRESLGVQYMKALKDNQEERKKFEELCLHGKDKDYYKLKLKGVIVHSGGPEVGHYWAISKKESSWIKFDDSRVMVFPHSSMESECYGGNYVSDEWGGMGSSTNAYVLLYEKQQKTDIVVGAQQNKRIVQFNNIETYNTPELYKQVWLDNHSLMLQNHLLRDSFCKEFIYFLVQMLKITPSDSKIQVIAQTLYKVCYHSGETGKLVESFMDNLNQIDGKILRDYILADKGRTFDLLFHNNQPVREFTALFIQKVLIQSWKKGSEEEKAEVKKLIEEYLGLLHHDIAKNWLRIDGYFKLFEGLVTNSVQIKDLHEFLIQKHLIAYFIDFIMQKSSPINIYPKKYSIGTKSNPAHFGYAINLIFFLFKRSFGFTGENHQIPKIDSQELFHLSDNDVLCLGSIGFYEKMLKERQNLEILGLIIQRLSIKNLKFSEAIARVLLITLNEITDANDEMVDVCGCISKYLIISDEFWTNRAQFVLGYSSPYIFNDNLLSSLDEERFVYSSTIEDLFPVECLLAYCHINRLRNPLAVLHILRTILEGCSVNLVSKSYLLSQKAPSYYHERYTDWIGPYVSNIIETLNLTKDKKQAVLKEVQLCNNYLIDLQSFRQPLTNVISGKTLNHNVVDRFANGDVEVVVSNVECYIVNSQPTGFGNKTFDEYLEHGRLNKRVTKDSNILCFFKEFNKPLAIKQAVEEAEEKALESLFDDCIDPRQAQSKMQAEKQSQQPTQIPNEPEKAAEPEKIVEQAPQLPSQQPIQQKIEVEISEINIPGVYVSPDYFRKIEIINNSTKSKRVTLNFRTVQNSNMLVPSKIHFLSTRKAVETMWICKIDEAKGWGIADYQINVDEKDTRVLPKSFKLYGQPQQHPQQINNEHVPENMEIEGPFEQTPNINQNGFDEEMLTEIECPVCTLLNLSTEINCEACGSSLRG